MIESRSDPLPGWIRLFPAIVGSCVLAIGCAVAAGWFYDIEILRTVSPRFVSMKPNAAAGFSCLALTLMLASRRSFVTSALRWVLEISVFALGASTLVEYALDADLGIDALLVPATLTDTAIPARMSMPTAVCFALLPIALSSERALGARGLTAARAVAICVGIIGWFALLGYVYGTPALYEPFPHGGAISLYSAAALMLTAAGIVTLQPQFGLPSIAAGPTLVGTHVRWLFPAAVVAPLLIGVLAVQTHEAFGVARLSIAVTTAGTTIAIGLIVASAAHWLRRMEEKIIVSNRALAATKQGVFIAEDGEDFPIIYVNEAFGRLTGYSERESLGRNCNFVVVDTQDYAALGELKEALAAGRNVTVTLSCRRRDGTVFSARMSVSVVPNGGKRGHLVGVLEDVTEERLASAARLELLAEASQARKEAESANHVKDVFFATVTHELRSPLNACAMWLDVLALGPLSEKSAKAVEAIKRNLKIQIRLVNDLIDAAQISSGGIEVHREPHELEQLIETNLETWQLTAATRGVTLSCRLGNERQLLDVDADRLVQVLNNLIENACANTPPGGCVELRVEACHDGVAIEVEDSGAGLSSEDLQRIFTPFWRAQSTKQSYGGLGLGLTIAEALVRGHEGTLSARSDGPGRGCVFTVRLPAATTRVTTDRSQALQGAR